MSNILTVIIKECSGPRGNMLGGRPTLTINAEINPGLTSFIYNLSEHVTKRQISGLLLI